MLQPPHRNYQGDLCGENNALAAQAGDSLLIFHPSGHESIHEERL